ncbi:MAG: ribonuclease HII [Ruminococcus sp.]|jgi:ribonuclease HII|nr:ribonuclease HII [Ruminococcus sp.]
MKIKYELFLYDRDVRKKYPVLCGIDEAGRGPLAGDVFAAAVILPENAVIGGLDDSKKLTEKKREMLFEEIKQKATAYGIGIATVAEIEKMNILNAAMLAMERAYEKMAVAADIALVDGNRLPLLSTHTAAIVKGDGKSASIAAASVLAKVSRDRYMTAMADKYPQYGFEKHKGYGTKMHYERLKEFGLSEIHRRSFVKKI